MSNGNKNVDLYLKRLFDSSIFIQTITKLHDFKIYRWAKKYSNHTNYFPFRHLYGLLSVAITIDSLSFNEILMNKSKNKSDIRDIKIKNTTTVFHYIFK